MTYSTTRYFFNHPGTPSNLNIELQSCFNYAYGEFYDCLRRGVDINAFMQESALGVQIQGCYLCGLHAENQPGIAGDPAELSGFISADGGSELAATLPPSLLGSRLDVSGAQTFFFPPNRGIRYTEEGPSSEDVVFATQSPETHKATLILLLLYF